MPPPSSQVRPRPRGAVGPRGSLSGGSPGLRGGGRGPQLPNSGVPRLPGVTQRPRPHAARQALCPGRGLGARGPTLDPDPSRVNLPRLPEPRFSLLYLPTPLLPLSFSASRPRHPGATVPKRVHTRTERALRLPLPGTQLKAAKGREPSQKISGPRPWSESGGLRAVGVRAPTRARARTRTPARTQDQSLASYAPYDSRA